jgi:hypothetical protein
MVLMKSFSLRERILFAGFICMTLCWGATAWCAWQWYEIGEGALKLLSVVASK